MAEAYVVGMVVPQEQPEEEDGASDDMPGFSSVQFVLVGMAKAYKLMLFFVIFTAAISEPENKREYPPPIKVDKYCSCSIPT
jgi:hypothetical protein